MSMTAGDPIYLIAEVRNVGWGMAPSGRHNTVYFEVDGQQTGFAVGEDAIGPGETVRLTASEPWLAVSGPHIFSAVGDMDVTVT